MSFNFGSLATVSVSNAVAYLKPYTINENVTIKATEIMSGTNKDGKPWKSLRITFGNDEGIYNDSIFWIDINNPNDTARKVVDGANGGKRELPSSWERVRDKMVAIGTAFNPDDFKKLQAISGKIKTFDDLMVNFKKIIDKVIGKNPTNMKLIGRNSNGTIYATLPNCTGIAQATEKTAVNNNCNVGEWYTWLITPFGDNLTFSAYEESQRSKLNTAKPTPMSDEVKAIDSSSDDIDFDL